MNRPNVSISKHRLPMGNKLKTSIATDAALQKSSENLGLPVRKPLLPPIVSKKDKEAVEKVKKFIQEEKEKIRCEEDVYDEKRFAIFSAALDKIINQSTAYKDLLSDIKREYEECISAIVNNQRESVFVRSRVKTLASLPTTIAGYGRRKMDLEEKLEILNAGNKELEAKFNSIQQGPDEPETVEKLEVVVKAPLQAEEEKRPIPGLPVEKWTDIETLQLAVSKLEYSAEELLRLQKSNYVTLSQKQRVDELLSDRLESHEKLVKNVKYLHAKNQRLRVAQEALTAFQKKKDENPGFKFTLGRFIIGKLITHHKKEQKAKATRLEDDIPMDDDDPGVEKEAELMLEYIEKFHELFNDGQYEKAAVHAANSPKGVLRNMETLKRFELVSLNFEGTPSPLLSFAIALMNSSSAQSHVTDKDMSLLCVQCALRENRPDLVKHWATTGCISSSNEIGRSLVRYSKKVAEYKGLCLVVAHKIFSDVENHHDACVTLYHLNRLQALVDYAQETADFTKNEYLNLIRACPDGALVMNLCRPYHQPYRIQHEEYEVRKMEVLPLRFDQAICAMIESEMADPEIIVSFLVGLYKGDWVSHVTGDRIRKEDSLHAIVYDETDLYTADDVTCDWAKIIRFCETNHAFSVAIEIQAAMAVKKAIANAVIALGQAGKEEFDYYT